MSEDNGVVERIESVLSLYRFDTADDRSRAAEAIQIYLHRAAPARLDQWQPIETHGGHCSPVLVCRETPTETVRATSAFLDVTGVWRLFGSRAGAARLRFKPTHWRPLPAPPQPQGEGGKAAAPEGPAINASSPDPQQPVTG